MEHIVQTEDFILKLKISIFEDDIHSPSNTLMDVFVKSNGFSGSSTMNIDIKEFAKFSLDLNQIYATLNGQARIEEPYGMHMYISFCGNGRGHISIKGYLHSGDRSRNEHTLEFGNCIDQTCIKDFCQGLQISYGKYAQK